MLRLRVEADSYVNPEALKRVVGECETVEKVGMTSIAQVNRAMGILEAYDHDPDMFYQWLMEAAHE